jgi:crossover junction endodeoxyribonuclease RuvC
MIFIGIDVGKAGALARLTADRTLCVEPTPVKDKEYDIHAMYTMLHSCAALDQTFCVIERAQAMPGQGVVSMFEFGKGYGLWLALLSALNIPYQVVHSRVWTKELLAGSPGEGKDRNIAAAKALFPSWEPKLKKDLEHCDAILLAEYARRKWGGKK